MASTKTIRVSLNFEGDSVITTLNILPIANEESKQIVKDCDHDAFCAYDPLLAEIGSKKVMSFHFAGAYSTAEIYVTDEGEEELYSQEEFEINPNYGVSSIEEAEDNYSDDEEELDNYKNYLNAEIQDTHAPEEKGIEKAWKGLADNTVSTSTFIPSLLGQSLKAAGASEGLLHGESDICNSSVTYHIEIPEDEEFDIDKLDFINIDEEYDDYSSILNELLAGDVILLNAIIYDGKLYFIENKDFGDAEGDSLYDIVNEDIESEIED